MFENYFKRKRRKGLQRNSRRFWVSFEFYKKDEAYFRQIAVKEFFWPNGIPPADYKKEVEILLTVYFTANTTIPIQKPMCLECFQ